MDSALESRLTSLPVLTEGACADWREALHEVREAWTQRHPLAPFFTLGAASYLDARGGYGAIAQAANPVLAGRFGPLQERVRQALETHLGAPVVLTARFALPGFHIFQAHPAFERPVASIHCDLQHLSLPWDPGADLSRTITFTLPVALPATGGGLDAWAIELDEWADLEKEQRVQLLKTRQRAHHPYALGRLELHTGRFVHRIAPSRGMHEGEERVTFHGHGVLVDGAWELYW